MRKILITGGAGFIGSNIANSIADGGEYHAVVCDRFGQDDKWHNISKHPIYEIITPEEMFYWLEGNVGEIEAVIHMGAISSTTETDVDLILENNFSLSKLLWSWCADQGVRFIYASSAASYGDGSQGFDDDMEAAALQKLKPMNAYGWSKWLFDQFVAASLRNEEPSPPQWAGLRFFNVYGPNEYHKGTQQSVASRIFPHAQAGRPVQLFKSYNDKYSDGGQLRDFIYVRDCVDVMHWLLENEGVSGLFNLGTGEARSFEDLAKAVFESVGNEPAVNYISMPEELKPKYQYFTEAKMDRLRAAGYARPFTSLEDGVKDYVKQYLAREDKYF